jgi:methionine-rich copper-binding protein CopC
MRRVMKRVMKVKRLMLATGLLFALGAAEADALLHFALSRSVPAADATVASPAEVRLWFTQVAKEGSVGIRVVNAAGEAIETAAPARDQADGRVYAVALPGPLAAGRYTVAWRGIGDDGHVVTGDFGFSVSAE